MPQTANMPFSPVPASTSMPQSLRSGAPSSPGTTTSLGHLSAAFVAPSSCRASSTPRPHTAETPMYMPIGTSGRSNTER